MDPLENGGLTVEETAVGQGTTPTKYAPRQHVARLVRASRAGTQAAHKGGCALARGPLRSRESQMSSTFLRAAAHRTVYEGYPYVFKARPTKP